jgi:hypothetical protein
VIKQIVFFVVAFCFENELTILIRVLLLFYKHLHSITFLMKYCHVERNRYQSGMLMCDRRSKDYARHLVAFPETVFACHYNFGATKTNISISTLINTITTVEKPKNKFYIPFEYNNRHINAFVTKHKHLKTVFTYSFIRYVESVTQTLQILILY